MGPAGPVRRIKFARLLFGFSGSLKFAVTVAVLAT
jgi:hypothetical protein